MRQYDGIKKDLSQACIECTVDSCRVVWKTELCYRAGQCLDSRDERLPRRV